MPFLRWFLGPKVPSRWKVSEIAIDAWERDWDLADCGSDGGLLFGFVNDRTDLYIILRSNTQGMKGQLLGAYGQALTVWVNAEGKMEKRFGIRFQPPAGNDGVVRREAVILMGSPGKVPAVSLPERHGVQAALGPSMRMAVFEAKVPLGELGIELPSQIKVGIQLSPPDPVIRKRLEAVEAERQAEARVREAREHKTRPGVNVGEGVPSGPQRRPSDPRERSLEMPMPIDFWIRVPLADGPKKN